MKIGDKVKALTNALGIEQCDACKERQAVLNGLGDRLMAMFGNAPSVMRPTMKGETPDLVIIDEAGRWATKSDAVWLGEPVTIDEVK